MYLGKCYIAKGYFVTHVMIIWPFFLLDKNLVLITCWYHSYSYSSNVKLWIILIKKFFKKNKAEIVEIVAKNVGNYTEAQKYLLPIIDATPVDEMDEAQIAEAQQLLDDIGINHFQVICFLFVFAK